MLAVKPFPLGALLLACALSGCKSVGPETIDRDSLEYGESWGTGSQRQMLLNIVKLRYGEAPMFLEVASVINQYSLEGNVTLNTPAWDRPTTFGPPFGSASGSWADRPTITYTPVMGERFTKSMLTPIPPVSLASMLQSGWPAEFVFGITARSINGLRNGTRAALLREAPDPRFGELLRELTKVQQASRLGLRIELEEEVEVVQLVVDHQEAGVIDESRQRVHELLGVEPGARSLRLTYGMLPSNDREIAILSRSVLEILSELSYGVEVPERHVREGRTPGSPEFGGSWAPPRIRIHSGEKLPKDAFVAVPHRNLWYWIDDRDFASKRLFSFAMVLMSLVESETRPGAPLVTVGAG